jgi:hypothetical protein
MKLHLHGLVDNANENIQVPERMFWAVVSNKVGAPHQDIPAKASVEGV